MGRGSGGLAGTGHEGALGGWVKILNILFGDRYMATSIWWNLSNYMLKIGEFYYM